MVGFPPQSPILIGFSIIFTIHWGAPIFGNTHLEMVQTKYGDSNLCSNYPPGDESISPPNGKFGKSSSSKVPKDGGYVSFEEGMNSNLGSTPPVCDIPGQEFRL